MVVLGVISVFMRVVTVLQGRWRLRLLDATPEGKRHNLHENRDHPYQRCSYCIGLR